MDFVAETAGLHDGGKRKMFGGYLAKRPRGEQEQGRAETLATGFVFVRRLRQAGFVSEHTLHAGRLDDDYKALGVAVSLMLTEPSFARLPFGFWSSILVGQIRRKHYIFALEGGKTTGFLLWMGGRAILIDPPTDSTDYLRSRGVAPKTIDVVDSIPLTAVGKHDKPALRASYWQGRDRAVN